MVKNVSRNSLGPCSSGGARLGDPKHGSWPNQTDAADSGGPFTGSRRKGLRLAIQLLLFYDGSVAGLPAFLAAVLLLQPKRLEWISAEPALPGVVHSPNAIFANVSGCGHAHHYVQRRHLCKSVRVRNRQLAPLQCNCAQSNCFTAIHDRTLQSDIEKMCGYAGILSASHTPWNGMLALLSVVLFTRGHENPENKNPSRFPGRGSWISDWFRICR
jgi:hypothetical protein